MKIVAILAKYFNEGAGKRPLTDFAKEVKALDDPSKKELGAGAAKILGVSCDDC